MRQSRFFQGPGFLFPCARRTTTASSSMNMKISVYGYFPCASPVETRE
jgi:hypothetical protein